MDAEATSKMAVQALRDDSSYVKRKVYMQGEQSQKILERLNECSCESSLKEQQS